MRFKLGWLALAVSLFVVGCNPCKSDQDCGSQGMCVSGACHDFSNDNVPCNCTNDVDCGTNGLVCTGGHCLTPLGSKPPCH